MQTEVFSFLMFGFVLGFRHALDPDHLVAVSTIVGERKDVFSSSMVGALWGVGHTASLLLVGVIVIALQVQIPARMAQGMEFGVALMLMALGVNALWKLLRRGKLIIDVHEHHAHTDVHSLPEHSHPSFPSLFTFKHLKSHIRNGKKSVAIGMVHGLAGSATLMLIVLATIPTKAMALGYILIFGIGSLGGMFLMSTLIGLPFIFTQRAGVPHALVRGLAGLASIAFGAFLAWQIVVTNGLLIQQ